MNQFAVLNVTSRDQQKVIKDIGVIGNVLGFRLIEIEQVSPRFREAQGIKVCKYKEIVNDSDIDDPKRKYPYRITGGQLSFVVNPMNNRPPMGTGKVAFLIDDNELLPTGALSGEERGWNREFLASHYAAGYFKVIDPELDNAIRNRHENILRASAESRKKQGDAAAAVDVRDAGGAPAPIMEAMRKLQEENKLLKKAISDKEKKRPGRPKGNSKEIPIREPQLPPDPKGYVEDKHRPVTIATETVNDGNYQADSGMGS